MTTNLETFPAHTVLPGTTVTADSVIFSTVFHDCRNCGLLLYHLPDLAEVRVPFTDEYRYGSLYSVRMKGLDPAHWAYRYYRDDYSFEDPYARELILLKKDGEEFAACRLFPSAEDELPSYGNRRTAPWPDRLIYCMHARGFTASRSSKVPDKGTFRGVIHKIPYLKELGITAVELLPVYELRPEQLGMIVGEPSDFHTNDKYSLSIPGKSSDDQLHRKTNYWNFGEGCYFAPKRAYAKSKSPQTEFKAMVDAFHSEGIEVYLQLFFPDTVTIQTQLETCRFYVTHYQIDGFHLKGSDSGLMTIASDPMLSDTSVFYYSFPYEELTRENTENPAVGRPSIRHLCEYTGGFQHLVRCFVKSDNQMLREFCKAFIEVPEKHGNVHYAANYEGFTLNDTVCYNWKHNEANGEENRDGTDENDSWNCGVEGQSSRRDVRSLRQRQLRNLMTLTILSQGTPLIYAGDERCNSQDGNNNPYCQDNETGWTCWKETSASGKQYDFTKKIIAFRKAHSIFRMRHPFRMSDYKVYGYPDVSFHGADAWKPDFGGYSHTVGILFNEKYAEENPADALIYLAVNMHWHAQMLAVPAPWDGFVWRVIADTAAEEDAFYQDPPVLADQHHISVRGRSICILRAVKEFEPAPKTQKPQKKAPADTRKAGNEGKDHTEKDSAASSDHLKA